MNNRQIDIKTTKQVRIDVGLHKEIKIAATEEQRSIKELVEDCLIDYLAKIKPIVT